jgi:hypothetical protein
MPSAQHNTQNMVNERVQTSLFTMLGEITNFVMMKRHNRFIITR